MLQQAAFGYQDFASVAFCARRLLVTGVGVQVEFGVAGERLTGYFRADDAIKPKTPEGTAVAEIAGDQVLPVAPSRSARRMLMSKVSNSPSRIPCIPRILVSHSFHQRRRSWSVENSTLGNAASGPRVMRWAVRRLTDKLRAHLNQAHAIVTDSGQPVASNPEIFQRPSGVFFLLVRGSRDMCRATSTLTRITCA